MDKDAFTSHERTPVTVPPLMRQSTQLVWAGLLVFACICFLSMHWRQSMAARGQSEPSGSPGAQSMGMRIDPNEASLRELSLLPGIGPKLADRILRDRQQHGPFGGLSDLSRVPGIGPRTMERIGPMVDVRPPQVSIASNQ